MKKILLFIVPVITATLSFAQPATTAPDFTITMTDGTVKNLYTTLNSGKTVVLDFFYTTCGYCIQYAPIIEQAFQSHGEGNGNIEFWGIDKGDSKTNVDAYKADNGVSNPCASGTEGGGDAATTLYSTTFTSWSGWPTYCVICPDKTINFDVNYPPTATGFDTFFSNCGATGVASLSKDGNQTGIVGMYPNPALTNSKVSFFLNARSNVRIEIYNILGEKLAEPVNKTFEAGLQSADISLVNLTSGNYIVKLIPENAVASVVKLNVAK